ncbi:MAG: hypothetical protein ACFBSC_17965 [Microcoleaceae cyanobacterium]
MSNPYSGRLKPSSAGHVQAEIRHSAEQLRAMGLELHPERAVPIPKYNPNWLRE